MRASLIPIMAVLFAVPSNAADKTKSDDPAKAERASATIADMAWLEGHWVGTGIDGQPAGETFSFAGNGQMVGHFWQLAPDGTVRFYELITVIPDGDSLVMRLKHFETDLTGWEGRAGDKALEFPLTERSERRWTFGPVTFDRPEDDRLDVSVRMRSNNGSEHMLRFAYRRHSP